jgi:hypothetical protein
LTQVPVAHTYNPSYSGGRDQEDHRRNTGEVEVSGFAMFVSFCVTKVCLQISCVIKHIH